jgi:4-aminobutyrate aminotransferase/(S)-3-amino-2-methylpropionate transaminase
VELVSDPLSRAPNAALTNAITTQTLKRGLITIRAGLYSNCLRFLPALTISDAQIDEGMAVLAEAIAAATAGDA